MNTTVTKPGVSAQNRAWRVVLTALCLDPLGMTYPPKLVVFSDLDGTLLDHGTYSWRPAAPALDRLRRLGIPVVLTSSKTAEEIVALQGRMGLSGQPAIVENGAGIIGHGPTDPSRCTGYTDIRQSLEALPHRLRSGFRGFGDMTVAEVMQLTGLSETDAQLAKRRTCSEPGLWMGTRDEKEEFEHGVKAMGLSVQQGGRFLTVSGGRTKADAMCDVMRRYPGQKSLALGDAPNDIEMLETADHGVIVANPHRPPLPTLKGETDGRIARTTQAGPAGWNTAVNALLDALEATRGTQANG